MASELAARATELAESAAAAPAALPSALVLVGRIRHWAGDVDGATSAYEEALAREPDAATTASALSCLGALLEHGDRFAEARPTLNLASAAAARVGAFRPLLRTLFCSPARLPQVPSAGPRPPRPATRSGNGGRRDGLQSFVAEVAPPAQANEAFNRVAAALPVELREEFATKGRLAGLLAARA